MTHDNDRRKAARDLLNSVRDIFGRWDATGALSSTVGRDEEQLDEEYIAKIAAMLLKNASVPEVAKFLDRVVTKSVGVQSDAARNLAFAEQFVGAAKGVRLK
ncbi:MAG: hypothetical protein U0136_21775 [Bdellovibrionota bacterium]